MNRGSFGHQGRQSKGGAVSCSTDGGPWATSRRKCPQCDRRKWTTLRRRCCTVVYNRQRSRAHHGCFAASVSTYGIPRSCSAYDAQNCGTKIRLVRLRWRTAALQRYSVAASCSCRRSCRWLVGWLVGWFAGWLVVGWLVGRLVRRFAGSFIRSAVGSLVDCWLLVVRCSFIGWSIPQFVRFDPFLFGVRRLQFRPVFDTFSLRTITAVRISQDGPSSFRVH